MKASDIPEAFQLQECIKHCDIFLEALPGDLLRISAGGVTIGVSLDDPQRALLDQAVTDFVSYMRRTAEAKLKSFDLEQDLKPSEITGFPEDDLPPPADSA